MSGNIDTRKVENRRQLRFGSIDDCIAEVRRIMQADSEGKLRALGNWTPGQNMAHVAAWIEYAYSGFPVKPPKWPIRWLIRRGMFKHLKTGMEPGVYIPSLKEGTTGMDAMPTQDAANRLIAALERLKSPEKPAFQSPLGPMSEDDRRQLNLRHAELHLGFLDYDR